MLLEREDSDLHRMYTTSHHLALPNAIFDGHPKGQFDLRIEFLAKNSSTIYVHVVLLHLLVIKGWEIWGRGVGGLMWCC